MPSSVNLQQFDGASRRIGELYSQSYVYECRAAQCPLKVNQNVKAKQATLVSPI